MRSYRGRAADARPGRSPAFADAGLLADGKPRYPLHDEQAVRTSYRHLGENKDRYSTGELADIRAAMIPAMRRFGVDPYLDAVSRAITQEEQG